MNDELRSELLRIYDDAERDIQAAGPVCQASGRCCRFKEYGHTLFVSSLEAEYLLSGAPPYEQPVATDFCPFQKNKLCTARDHRPLGCRVFYCDPAYQETGNQITEKYLAELKALANRLGQAWAYAPLHHFLDTSG